MQRIHYVAAFNRLGQYLAFHQCDSTAFYCDPEEFVGSRVGTLIKDESEGRQLRAAFSECMLTGEQQVCMVTGVHGTPIQCQFNKIVNNSDRTLFDDDEAVVVMIVFRLPAEPTQLSERELQIVKLICRDQSSGEIARQLGVKTSTVETHRQNIRQKLGVSGTAGIVLYAVEHGLVDWIDW